MEARMDSRKNVSGCSLLAFGRWICSEATHDFKRLEEPKILPSDPSGIGYRLTQAPEPLATSEHGANEDIRVATNSPRQLNAGR